MTSVPRRLVIATVVTGALLITIFATAVILFRGELRDRIHDKIVERDAAMLSTLAEAQLREAEADPNNHDFASEMLLPSVLKLIRGMRGVAIYDVEGNVLSTSPESLIQPELAPDDFESLQSGNQISRYHAAFPLQRVFAEYADHPATAPMLDVLLPLRAGDSGQVIGYVRYLIDARPLGRELREIDERVDRQTYQTLGIGAALIVLVVAAAGAGLIRARRIIAERNERLTRANFELTLAAKTSALGVITSHLIHGLQGPVAGLRAVMADRAAENAAESEWKSAANYAERMQTMIHETVALLGETSTQTSYELTGFELASTIGERNRAAAVAKGVILRVDDGFPQSIDSHRGSLICLIATNLIQNAIEATDPGRHVTVNLACGRRRESEGESGRGSERESITLRVIDEGRGIPESLRPHLFEPGRTGRVGGTGLGLAISQLLARQIGATLELAATSAAGTTFRLIAPVA